DRLREESRSFQDRYYGYTHFAGRRVLDVGSGNGYILSRYARAGAIVDGVDITPAAVDLCRSRFDCEGLQGTFQEADAQQLPFADDTFDCVCSMGVLHHVPDTAAAVREIFRVLRPGGALRIMMYHRDSLLYRVTFPWVGVITRKSRQQLVDEVDGVGNPKGDVYSRTELRNLLSAFTGHEFEVNGLRGWMLLPKIGYVLPNFLFRPFEARLGWKLYVKAQKSNA
ncbi:MAG: class I SAM-dependent methyltransferase, partial [Verrucomicrobia bacterium]|nr:class I SAM-dependent methyltransferase [Verrucomicrobiota bacterium]